MKPRIIFDRSAFHGEHFEALLDSPLLWLAQTRQISIYHSASLIEETASLYMKKENRPLLRKQLPFILEICKDRWLQPTEILWIKELVELSDEKQTVFVPTRTRQEMENVLRKLALDELPMDEHGFRETYEAKMSIKQKSKRLRSVLVQMRNDIGQQLKDSGKSLSQGRPTFQAIVEKELAEMGTGILMRHLDVQADMKSTICTRWAKTPHRFPYYTAFASGMLYAAYYAMTEHSHKIDVNTQMDVEHLTYLHGTDILVSNDIKFMKSAFDALWLLKGKKFMTTDQFIGYLRMNFPRQSSPSTAA